jgi:PAS domain S-box-containing protein
MPITLTQNRKIAITAVALFLLSFAFMLFFLKNGGEGSHSQVDVLGAGNHGEESSEVDMESFYREYTEGNQLEPIFVTNTEGIVSYSVEAFCDLISVECETLIGSSIFDYINSEDLTAVFSNHTKLIQDGEVDEGIGPYRMLKSDKEILVLLSVYPILGEDEKVTELVFLVKDLTEQVEEMNSDDSEDSNSPEKKDENWIYDLYPKIKDTGNTGEVRMVVDKISFNSGD